MPSVEDTAKIALALPEVTESLRWGNRTWLVRDKGFAWQRPLSKADVRRLAGAPVPSGELLAVRVADMDDKHAVLAMHPEALFDIEHFQGYPAVLVKLEVIKPKVLKELVVDAWLACAPSALARDFLGPDNAL